MPHLPSAFVEFRATLARHVRELGAHAPSRQSTAWYFLRYVERVRRTAERTTSARACSGEMRGLLRFYVDRVAHDSPLAVRFDDIQVAYARALAVAGDG